MADKQAAEEYLAEEAAHDRELAGILTTLAAIIEHPQLWPEISGETLARIQSPWFIADVRHLQHLAFDETERRKT
jgi:hypothetical protein